ncbi:MAG TPA: ABC transporter permease [Pyrinomonadaceae bacterium]|nr:ABC transporter permease [Pyrinomonadaceae bacterium]
MGILLQDLRYGARMLVKSPGFTVVVVLALALGIGANSAIFSVVNSVLLRPLAFNEPQQLMMVWGASRNGGGADHIVLSVPDMQDLRSQSQTLEYVVPYYSAGTTVSSGEDSERVFGALSSADLFPALGVKPLMGRVFTREEDVPGGPSVVVISQSLWQRAFGSDPSIVGKEIKLGSKAATVVGVMPASFRFPLQRERPDYWQPISISPSYIATKDKRDTRSLKVLARVKPGVTTRQANEEMATISRRLEEQYPDSNTGLSLSVTPLHEDLVGQVRPALLVILGAVGFVLLIACANVANLLLARAASRQKEIAIRTALGAGRLHIIRQLLTESLLLAVMGGGLGLLLATWGLDLLVAASPADLPRVGEIGLDIRVLLFTGAVSILTGILFGLAPALQASRLDLNESLKEGSRGSTEGSARNRLRSVLVVAEIALSLVLLIGAGLLIRSFVTLLNTSPGFDADSILTVDLPLSRAKYPEAAQQVNVVQQLIERTSQVPGVASAAVVNILPLSGNGRQSSFTIEGRPAPPNGQEPDAQASTVTPDYFRTMGIPLMRGRVFNEGDKKDAPPVVIISEDLARKNFAGEDPLGKRLVINDDMPPFEIVGIVGDIRHEKLETETEPEYYSSFYQLPERAVNLVVRAAPGADPASLQLTVRSAIKQLDNDQLIWEMKTMEQRRAESVARRRFNMMLVGIFASLALLLAALGIYGVMSYTVTQRTHEIGIRIALGAQTRDIIRMVVVQGMTLALVGVGAGLLAAFGVTRVMASLLYGVTATDALTFAAVTLGLTGLALVACLIPALRATRVDPMTALRYE